MIVHEEVRPNAFGGSNLIRISHLESDRYAVSILERTKANPVGRWHMGEEFNVFLLESGAVRWEESGHYLMESTIRDMAIDHTPTFDWAAHRAAYDAHLRGVVDAYRRSQPARPSPEELAEMRANFPAGSRIVDVVSGRIVQL